MASENRSHKATVEGVRPEPRQSLIVQGQTEIRRLVQDVVVASDEHIITAAAGDSVRKRTAVEHVVAVIAEETIGARPTKERVISTTTMQFISSVRTGQQVIAVAAEDCDGKWSTAGIQRVIRSAKLHFEPRCHAGQRQGQGLLIDRERTAVRRADEGFVGVTDHQVAVVDRDRECIRDTPGRGISDRQLSVG